MSHFYKNHQNSSKNTPFLGANEAQIETKKEQGRSMVEMLGVLAVVGALSIGAISGYRYAMNKYRANQVVNELNLLSHQVAMAIMSKYGVIGTLKLGEPYDSGKLSSSGYAFAAGCGENAQATATCDGQTQYSMKISGLSQPVCEEARSQGQYLQYINEVTGSCSSGNNNSLVFQFNTEMATNTAVSSETEADTPQTSVSVDSEWDPVDEENPYSSTVLTHSGDWEPIVTVSDNHSIDVPKEKDPVVQQATCSGNGKLLYGQCVCFAGYSGTSCETIDTSCSGNGVFTGSCSCDSDHYGEHCQFSISKCEQHGHYGLYLYGYCDCSGNYGGHECDVENACNGGGWFANGYSSYGKCLCPSGHYGADCSLETDPCGEHGSWWGGNCHCSDGYEGAYCDQPQGTICKNGTWSSDGEGDAFCSCANGWCGADCSIKSNTAQ